MHSQMNRLYEAAKLLRGIDGQTNLAFALNSSPQTIYNWEQRGMSKAGMLKAQEVIGCSATWLDTGAGDMRQSSIVDIRSPQQLPRLQRLSADEDEMLELYRMSPDTGRETVKEVLRTLSKTALLDQAQLLQRN